MNIKTIGILVLVLFITSFSFAAAPTVGELVFTPEIVTNDLNYFTFPLDINATATGDVTGGVLCWYSLTDSTDTYETTFDPASNTCMLLGLTSAAGGDWNFSMIIPNLAGDSNGISNVEYTYRDSNVPSVAGVVTGGTYSKTLTITSTDTATDIGDGSGTKTIYYKVNNDAWAPSVDNPTVITKTATGSYTIQYYSIDNLDNNGYSFLSSNSFTVQQASDEGCATLVWAAMLITILLAYVVIMKLIGMADLGRPDINLMITLAITIIIGILIIASFTSGVCVS